jgi:hypothetical protein
LGPIDLLAEVAGLGDYASVKNASDRFDIHGMEILVLSIEGLLKSKRAAGRPKDVSGIKELEGLLDLRKKTDLH